MSNARVFCTFAFAVQHFLDFPVRDWSGSLKMTIPSNTQSRNPLSPDFATLLGSAGFQHLPVVDASTSDDCSSLHPKHRWWDSSVSFPCP